MPLSTDANWGDAGHYERIAGALMPASTAVLDLAAARPWEVVLDLGCGTGNASLEAARRGSRAIGVDPAPRLLAAARSAAAAERLDAAFLLGTAERVPLQDSVADVLLSVFGVVFSADVPGTVAEIGRLLSPAGRCLLTAWLPTGALAELGGTAARAVSAATGATHATRFAWHDPEAVRDVMAQHELELEATTRHEIAFTAVDPGAFLQAEIEDHPMMRRAFAELRAHGADMATRAEMLSLLERHNEDAPAFRVTSEYVIHRCSLRASSG